MKDANLYVTSDFDICCVLRHFGCEWEEEFKDKGRKHWAFKRSERLNELLARFWKRELHGNIPQFLDMQKFVKNSLYNQD
jgi:hypothetical protein